MKKRLLAVLLALTAVMSLIPVTAWADYAIQYGQLPIYIGYADVDYMADEILKEIPTQGKSAKEQIRAVYDWIIYNCKRDGWDGQYHFDEEAVSAAVDDYYYEQTMDRLKKGEILLRIDYEDSYDSQDGFLFLGCDSRTYIASFARDMMLTRSGNCAHYSALLAVLLGHLGFDCRLIDGDFVNSNGSQMEHKWNYVLVDGRYYWLDVRIDHATYARTGKIDHRYFMVEDTSKWDKSHNWDHTYSDWLSANVDTVLEGYTISAVANSEKPWQRCSVWAAEQLEQACQRGLLPDCLAGMDLTQNITREEFCYTVVQTCEELLGKTIESQAYAMGKHLTNPFTDVSDSKLVAAQALGITSGTSETTFSPDSPLTREQGALMLRNAFTKVLGMKAYSASIDNFTDADSISDWARPGVEFAYAVQAINGYTDGRFGPQDSLTREQAVVILNKMFAKASD